MGACVLLECCVYDFVCVPGLTPRCRSGKWTDRQGTAEGCQWEVHREVMEGCRAGKHKLMGFESSSLQQEKKPPASHSPAAGLQHLWWENEPTICCPGLTCVLVRVCLSRCPGLAGLGQHRTSGAPTTKKKTPNKLKPTSEWLLDVWKKQQGWFPGLLR